MRGHVAPAALAHGFPERQQLAVDLDDGTQLARCLRCDAWIHTPVPASTDLPAELPRPIRGRALDELVVIRIIAIDRGIHAVLFLLLALGLVALQFKLSSLQEQAQQLLPVLDQTRSGQQFLSNWLVDLISLDNGHLWVLVAMSLGYTLLEGVESVFLWRGKRWAEYLTVVATAAFLPLAVNELLVKVTPFRVLALLVDLAILAYLIWAKRLFGVRGGQRKLEADLAADVDWDAIHARAPISPAASPSVPRTPHR